MSELLTLFKDASPALVLVVVIAYFARQYLEGSIKARFSKLESLMQSHVALTQGLRTEEHKELVDFRVAIERWEYFLQTGIGDITMRSETAGFEPAEFHRRDVDLFGAVREAAVKASILLQDKALEVELLKTITAIRNMYYPLLAGTMQKVLAIQEQMLPFLVRMRQFEVSGTDLAAALKPEEARQVTEMRHRMTEELRAYCEGLVAAYRPIAEQLYDLKERINAHIYRPVRA